MVDTQMMVADIEASADVACRAIGHAVAERLRRHPEEVSLKLILGAESGAVLHIKGIVLPGRSSYPFKRSQAVEYPSFSEKVVLGVPMVAGIIALKDDRFRSGHDQVHRGFRIFPGNHIDRTDNGRGFAFEVYIRDGCVRGFIGICDRDEKQDKKNKNAPIGSFLLMKIGLKQMC